jgi:hypothetical protein
VTEEAKKATPRKAKVRTVPGNWHLVEYGNWQVSVGPDAMIMLPRHVHPREVEDFVGAMLAAAEVGKEVAAANAENHREVDLENLPSDAAIVTEGPPPPGAVKMAVTERAATAATIGRKRRDPRAPRPAQPAPQPPVRGARYGRPQRQQ